MLIFHPYILFGEVSVKVLEPYFDQVFFNFLKFSFKNLLYMFGNSPLPDMPFADVFPESVACLLILLRLVFTEQSF